MPGFFGHIKFLGTTFKGRQQKWYPAEAEHGFTEKRPPFLEPENDLMENKQLQLKWWLSEISSFSGLLVTSSAFPGEVENVRDVICWETNQSACPGKAWKPAFQVDKPWGLFSCFILFMVQKSQTTTWDVSNPINNGINYQPQLVQDFSHQQ